MRRSLEAEGFLLGCIGIEGRGAGWRHVGVALFAAIRYGLGKLGSGLDLQLRKTKVPGTPFTVEKKYPEPFVADAQRLCHPSSLSPLSCKSRPDLAPRSLEEEDN